MSTEYQTVHINAREGAVCLTCGATLIGTTNPYPREGEYTLAEAKDIHTGLHAHDRGGRR